MLYKFTLNSMIKLLNKHSPCLYSVAQFFVSIATVNTIEPIWIIVRNVLC